MAEIEHSACSNGIIINTKNTHILLGIKTDGRMTKGKYMPPGGGIEAGEEPFQTVIREIMEETGIKGLCPFRKKPFYIYDIYIRKINRKLKIHFYHLMINNESFFNDSEELFEVAFYDFETVNKFAEQGKLSEATVSALQMLEILK